MHICFPLILLTMQWSYISFRWCDCASYTVSMGYFCVLKHYLMCHSRPLFDGNLDNDSTSTTTTTRLRHDYDATLLHYDSATTRLRPRLDTAWFWYKGHITTTSKQVSWLCSIYDGIGHPLQCSMSSTTYSRLVMTCLPLLLSSDLGPRCRILTGTVPHAITIPSHSLRHICRGSRAQKKIDRSNHP